MPAKSTKVLANNFNASNLKKPVNKTVETQIINEKRFAAKGAYSKDFLQIVKSFPKYFWDKDQKCWTLPTDEHEAFVIALTEKKFIHKLGEFYVKDCEFKNSVLLKFDYINGDLEEYTKAIFATDEKINVYIHIQYYTKSFSDLIANLSQLDGDFTFDNDYNCFTFNGKLSIIVDYFKIIFLTHTLILEYVILFLILNLLN